MIVFQVKGQSHREELSLTLSLMSAERLIMLPPCAGLSNTSAYMPDVIHVHKVGFGSDDLSTSCYLQV